MLKEIRLNVVGEILLPYPNTEHRDDRKIQPSSYVGIHKFCDGWIHIRKVSNTHNVLCCNSCSLRITIPNKIRTWKELAKFCVKLNKTIKKKKTTKKNKNLSFFDLLDIEE